jgi:putative Mg2+ transporter-C (MgtC) family protein
VNVVILTTADAIFAAATIGAVAGEGRLLIAVVATVLEGFVLEGFVLEIRHVRVLNMLDGRRWAGRFRDDEAPLPGDPGGPAAPADP